MEFHRPRVSVGSQGPGILDCAGSKCSVFLLLSQEQGAFYLVVFMEHLPIPVRGPFMCSVQGLNEVGNTCPHLADERTEAPEN